MKLTFNQWYSKWERAVRNRNRHRLHQAVCSLDLDGPTTFEESSRWLSKAIAGTGSIIRDEEVLLWIVERLGEYWPSMSQQSKVLVADAFIDAFARGLRNGTDWLGFSARTDPADATVIVDRTLVAIRERRFQLPDGMKSAAAFFDIRNYTEDHTG